MDKRRRTAVLVCRVEAALGTWLSVCQAAAIRYLEGDEVVPTWQGDSIQHVHWEERSSSIFALGSLIVR